MGLVHKKNIFSPDPVGKKTAQIHMGIKEVIVIADHRIGEQAHVQTQFKGTDLILLRIRLNPLPGEIVRMGQ